ncbi:50S ribosomal protein L34e [archaeon]|nr:50S ribosomal protein L34e [archaeon]TET26945.1 MAG: 50S ribosomal protein L34e [Candidatus Bathyarchaeum sp.]
MPQHSRRSRSKKRSQTKSSGGRTLIHYRAGKTSLPCCSNCGQTLAGLPRPDSAKISKLTGTKRRVGRMYSGNLCHGCLRSLLRQAARNL